MLDDVCWCGDFGSDYGAIGYKFNGGQYGEYLQCSELLSTVRQAGVMCEEQGAVFEYGMDCICDAASGSYGATWTGLETGWDFKGKTTCDLEL